MNIAGDSISHFELMSVDLPFRLTFKHAAAARSVSNSIFVKCVTKGGSVGYGESLPREYVTGESQASAHELLNKENVTGTGEQVIQ